MGPLVCTRSFEPVLDGKFIQLTAVWTFNPPKGAKPRAPYEETCLFGAHAEQTLGFWSFALGGAPEGQLLAILIMAVMAVEMAVGFALVVAVYRARQADVIESLGTLKE